MNQTLQIVLIALAVYAIIWGAFAVHAVYQGPTGSPLRGPGKDSE